MIQSQVLIQGLPADTKFTCQLRFLFAGGGPLPQLGYLFWRQRFLAAPVGSALSGERDAFPLPLADQGPLEFGERPMTDSIRFAIGESSPVKVRLSLTNSMRTPRLVSFCTRRRKSSRLRAKRSML